MSGHRAIFGLLSRDRLIDAIAKNLHKREKKRHRSLSNMYDNKPTSAAKTTRPAQRNNSSAGAP